MSYLSHREAMVYNFSVERLKFFNILCGQFNILWILNNFYFILIKCFNSKITNTVTHTIPLLIKIKIEIFHGKTEKIFFCEAVGQLSLIHI